MSSSMLRGIERYMVFDRLDALLFALVFLHLITSYKQLMQLSSSLHWIKHRSLPDEMSSHPNTVYILIPVFREEEKIIRLCAEYFSLFSSYPHVYTYFITTEKEGESNNTVMAVKKLSKMYAFSWLHYPGQQGFKAHQLNWAIEQILEQQAKTQDRRTYFAVYDVDSRPEIKVMEEILCGKEPVYQQPSIYLENYKRISMFQKSGALLQTKWELCRNIPVLRDNQKHLHYRGKISSLPCCTGHGLFIRADVFCRVGLFDTETLAEDLELGYRLAFYGIPITPLKRMDFAGYAPTFLATVPQTSRWFSAEMDLHRFYKKSLRTSSLNMLVFKRYYTTFKWALGAPLIYIAFIILAMRHKFSIIFIFISIYLYIYKPFRMLCNFSLWYNWIEETNFLVLLLLGCIRTLCNSFGPFYYLLTAPVNFILGKPKIFVKTPKN